MYYCTAEERIADNASCIASNTLGQPVEFKRLVVNHQAYIRFTLFRIPGAGTSWPVELVRQAAESDLGAAVAAALSKNKKPVDV